MDNNSKILQKLDEILSCRHSSPPLIILQSSITSVKVMGMLWSTV